MCANFYLVQELKKKINILIQFKLGYNNFLSLSSCGAQPCDSAVSQIKTNLR